MLNWQNHRIDNRSLSDSIRWANQVLRWHYNENEDFWYKIPLMLIERTRREMEEWFKDSERRLRELTESTKEKQRQYHYFHCFFKYA